MQTEYFNGVRYPRGSDAYMKAVQNPPDPRKLDISLLRNGKQPSNLATTIEITENLKVLDDPKEKPPPGHGCFRVMTPKDGDKRIVWDRHDFASIQEAKRLFDECVAQGLVPYCVGTNGRASSEVMTEFDPLAEEVIFLAVEMVAGG
jgi:hypothetical protein